MRNMIASQQQEPKQPFLDQKKDPTGYTKQLLDYVLVICVVALCDCHMMAA